MRWWKRFIATVVNSVEFWYAHITDIPIEILVGNVGLQNNIALNLLKGKCCLIFKPHFSKIRLGQTLQSQLVVFFGNIFRKWNFEHPARTIFKLSSPNKVTCPCGPQWQYFTLRWRGMQLFTAHLLLLPVNEFQKKSDLVTNYMIALPRVRNWVPAPTFIGNRAAC